MSVKPHPALRYTALRIGIFLACLLVLWLLAYARVLPVAGATGAVLLLALAALISAPISYVLLSGERDAMSERIVNRVERAKRQIAESRSREDAADDVARTARQ